MGGGSGRVSSGALGRETGSGSKAVVSSKRKDAPSGGEMEGKKGRRDMASWGFEVVLGEGVSQVVFTASFAKPLEQRRIKAQRSRGFGNTTSHDSETRDSSDSVKGPG